MKHLIKKWNKINCLTRIAYLLTVLLFAVILIEGLILESLNMPIIDFNIVLFIYVLSIIFSVISRQWKLILVSTFGALIVWAVTIGISEVLWYYLKKWMGIDISYR